MAHGVFIIPLNTDPRKTNFFFRVSPLNKKIMIISKYFINSIRGLLSKELNFVHLKKYSLTKKKISVQYWINYNKVWYISYLILNNNKIFVFHKIYCHVYTNYNSMYLNCTVLMKFITYFCCLHKTLNSFLNNMHGVK